MVTEQEEEKFSAWNPGVKSEIPPSCRECETIYDPTHVYTTHRDVAQFVADTGVNALEIINFRPRRLVLHEVIVRVGADIVVLEGDAEEDLGINFRAIACRIFNGYLEPRLHDIEHNYAAACDRIKALITGELNELASRLTPVRRPPQTFWQRLTGNQSPVVLSKTRQELEFELVNEFKSRQLEAVDEFERAVLRSLHRVLSSVISTSAFIGSNCDYLARVCELHAVNYLSSRIIAREVSEPFNQAVETEGYDLIPDAEHPVLISLKGASASGKSSLRPMLRSMMRKLGIEDHGYGTISPDIWRRLLLDYESLGEHYKYAGRLTSHEVGVIDARLDRYIRAKAEQRQSIPHLVVDRFRFDSFASEKITRVLHKTYVSYIDTMYMYFIVTPPEATVERGWQRGLERGRYKAVDDFLGHCVEAYTGMPKLLFKWLANDRPRYFFEFLDNSVPRGCYPELIARGSQDSMQIFEPAALIDIERYKRINILATGPEQVAATADDLVVKKNIGFLRQCVLQVDHVDFVDAESKQTYVSVDAGVFKVMDRGVFESKLAADETLWSIMAELAPDLLPNDL